MEGRLVIELADACRHRGEVDADFLTSLSRNGSSQIRIARLHLAAGKGEMPRPRIAFVPGALDNQEVDVRIGGRAQQQDDGSSRAPVSFRFKGARGWRVPGTAPRV